MPQSCPLSAVHAPLQAAPALPGFDSLGLEKSFEKRYPKKHTGIGEMAQWLCSQTALAEDPGSVPSIHTRWLTKASNSSSWHLTPSSPSTGDCSHSCIHAKWDRECGSVGRLLVSGTPSPGFDPQH